MTNTQELSMFQLTQDKASFEVFYDNHEYFLFNLAYKLTSDKNQSEILLTKVLKRIKENPSIVLDAHSKNQSVTLLKLTVQMHKESCQDLSR